MVDILFLSVNQKNVCMMFSAVPEGVLDEQMDLLRALEMSRIQFLKEQGVVYEETDNR